MFETHPDLGGDEQEFIKVRNAYLTLHDEDSRLEYDMEEPKGLLTISVTRGVEIEESVAAVVENRLCWWKEPWSIVTDEDYKLLEIWVDMLMSVAYDFRWQGEIRVGLISKQKYSVFDNMALIGIGETPSKDMAALYILWRMITDGT